MLQIILVIGFYCMKKSNYAHFAVYKRFEWGLLYNDDIVHKEQMLNKIDAETPLFNKDEKMWSRFEL